MKIDYNQTIPNNVGLVDDRRLLRALEQWQPAFLRWWQQMGPVGSAAHEVYLRTAISVENDGWAHYGYVRMPDYRWGIFLAEPEVDRRIGFGQHIGQKVWTEVPGEY
ncbi:MAG: benzoyl-CoA 2,3-epoxidase subunit BoxB, partial [Alphaproteobacteria bacterium]|nr:benzoyl-CoA 2,3-epoxidase subunit BoxB [Alphaproteobacteria bacterium]